LNLLIRAMFNQANSWVRLGRYQEARNVYGWIVNDFSRLGDEEAVLRVRHADLFARWKESPGAPIADELRGLIGEYEAYIQEQRDSRSWHVHKVNLVQAYSLMLSQLAHAEPGRRASAGEVLGLMEAMRQPQQLSGVGQVEAKRPFWHFADSLNDKAEVLSAYLGRTPGTLALFVDSGVDELVFLAVRGGSVPADERCLLAPAAPELVGVLTALLKLWPEELDRISRNVDRPKAPASPELERLAGELWAALPDRLREWLETAATILFSPGSFGVLDQFPIEMLRADAGWMALTCRIARVPTTRALMELLSPNRLPSGLEDRAYIFRADDPPGFARLTAADEEAEAATAFAGTIGLLAEREEEVSVRRLAAAFDAGYRLLHYVGHGVADGYDELLPVTADEGLRTNTLGSLAGHRTPFVVLSACEVGRGRLLAGGRAKGITIELLHHGAPGVVAALQPVPDVVALDVIEQLYRGFAMVPAGEAMRRMRKALAEVGYGPVVWGIYSLYGDPDVTLSPQVAGHPTRTADQTIQWPDLLRRHIASESAAYRDACLAGMREHWSEETAAFPDAAAAAAWLSGESLTEEEKLRLCERVLGYELMAAVSLRLLLAHERIVAAEASATDESDGEAARRLLGEIYLGLTATSAIADAICWTRFAASLVDAGLSRLPLSQIMDVLNQSASQVPCLRAEGKVYACLCDRVERQIALLKDKDRLVVDADDIIRRAGF
jgi:hypothetical protein